MSRTVTDSLKVMESFDMFLNGNFVALGAFQQKYGVMVAAGEFSIPTKWQSALFQAGQCGAFVGVFLAGPITNRIGYRWTTILGLILMILTIFVSFFVSKMNTTPQLSTNRISGQLARTSCSRPSTGGYSMGLLHRQLSCICVRNCTPSAPWCLHGYSADVMVNWFHHRRCRNILLQQT